MPTYTPTLPSRPCSDVRLLDAGVANPLSTGGLVLQILVRGTVCFNPTCSRAEVVQPPEQPPRAHCVV